MHHAMSDGLNIACALDLGNLRAIRRDVARQIIQRSSNVTQGRGQSLPRVLPVADSDNGLAPDTLHLAAADAIVFFLFDLFEVGGNDLELQTGTAGVQNEDVHCRCFLENTLKAKSVSKISCG